VDPGVEKVVLVEAVLFEVLVVPPVVDWLAVVLLKRLVGVTA